MLKGFVDGKYEVTEESENCFNRSFTVMLFRHYCKNNQIKVVVMSGLYSSICLQNIDRPCLMKPPGASCMDGSLILKYGREK